jgi:hypothetical protein
VSATRENGSITEVVLTAEEEASIKLKLPFEKYTLTSKELQRLFEMGIS